MRSSMRFDHGKLVENNNDRHIVILHKAHAYLNSDAVDTVRVEKVMSMSLLSNVRQKKPLSHGIARNLVYDLSIRFNSDHVRQYGFTSR